MNTKVWAKLSARMLKDAAAEFGNHGCNDFDLSELGLTREEQIEVITFMHEQNGDPEEIPDAIRSLPMTADFAVMYTCAAWLKKLAEAS